MIFVLFFTSHASFHALKWNANGLPGDVQQNKWHIRNQHDQKHGNQYFSNFFRDRSAHPRGHPEAPEELFTYTEAHTAAPGAYPSALRGTPFKFKGPILGQSSPGKHTLQKHALPGDTPCSSRGHTLQLQGTRPAALGWTFCNSRSTRCSSRRAHPAGPGGIVCSPMGTGKPFRSRGQTLY